MRVVLATHNPGKVREFQGILGAMLPELEIVAYDGPEPVEDGTSFDENALIKARAAAAHTGLPALADDSGICVDVLGGAPGIFSARWAGHGRGAQANLELLLDQLADIAPEHRSAHFTCHIALVVPETGFEQVVSGEWAGSIAAAPRGDGGHGYDPIFLPEGLEVTAAELTAEQKNALSHRARAFDAALPVLRMSLITD
ncbi:RdgB/HAM1 family non-canonical purine NTP pyrophosphatase [Herbiconiux sp. YIM B11900]|uniref:RdgB/HAM1 family non-canonical purine NTP pyrophosphatase n=1 Tax=Herbiconiux sp. YIM B11900 TaxID=3404131 RepID=UPI003F84BC33